MTTIDFETVVDRLRMIQLQVHGYYYDLDRLLTALAGLGFTPSIYKRGKYWRAHIDTADNCWHDGVSPHSAVKGALKKKIQFLRGK